MRALRIAALGALASAFLAAAPAQGARFIAGNDGGDLAYFESSNPKRFVKLDVTGLDGASETFSGLDVRPANGKLWALTRSFPSGEHRVYRVKVNLDQRSAEVAKLAGPFTITGVNDSNLGFAFDPVSDEMRIVEHDSDANLRMDALTFDVGVDTDLAYAAGDDNFGVEPGVQAIGYTSQRQGVSRSRLYGIDEFTDSLVRARPPGDGLLHTVGPLDVNTLYGFDFDIAPGGDAFAILNKASPGPSGARLFRVNLRTGEVSGLGQVGKRNEFGQIPEYGRPFSFALVSRRLVR